MKKSDNKEKSSQKRSVKETKKTVKEKSTKSNETKTKENSSVKKHSNIFSKKLFIAFGVILVLVIGIIFLSKSNLNHYGDVIPNGDIKYVQNGGDELSLGEIRYLQFLWMVDGAFNYERYNNEDFYVNDKKLERQPDFTCIYDNEMKTCKGVNFEENYHKLFASNVKMDFVYGDGLVGMWYEKRENDYFFTNINYCDAGRMNTKQKLTVENVTDKKITYKVTYDEELKSGIFKGSHHFEKDFVLVYENGDWKVSEAYFHDPCYMDYIIN